MPKPIVWTHDSLYKSLEMGNLITLGGYESQDNLIRGKRMFLTLPPFHVSYPTSDLESRTNSM